MKRVIGIYTYYIGSEPYWDETSDGMGGSETWAIRISEEFQVMGFHVIVFGNPRSWHTSSVGVEYVPRSLFERRCEYQHFDYFISSRCAYEICPDIRCDNVYIMSHEAVINGASSVQDLKLGKVRKIACLSEWHRKILMERYPGIPGERFFVTFNGVDQSLYSDVEMDRKENMMVWSTCKERGLRYFIKAIYPCIKIKIPDFHLAVCSYNGDVDDSYRMFPGIEIYGKLGKKDLADLQKRARIWIYPGYGRDEESGYEAHETFCMSAVENAMARNIILCGNSSGLSTTLNGYAGLIGNPDNLDVFDPDPMKLFHMRNEMTVKAVESLTDGIYANRLIDQSYAICSKYTWRESAMSWIKEWGMYYGD